MRLAPLILALICFGCKPRQDGASLASDDAASAGSTAPSGGFGPLMAGLAAEPGSPKRLEAAGILKDAFAPVLGRIEGRLAGKELSDSDKVGVLGMRNVLKWTLGYLDGTESCAPEERLTLYRGTGSQPFFRSGPAGKPFMLNVIWLKQIASSVKKLRDQGKISYAERTYEGMASPDMPRLGGDDFGVVAFANRDQLEAPRVDSRLFQALADFDDSIDYYGSFHTEGENGPTMLFSTSLNPRVAQTFAPGFVELSVCPERAVMVAATTHMREFEVYVPFFLLPEEIVRVDGELCGQLGRLDAPERCARPKPIALPEPKNTATKIYRSCIANFATFGESQAARLSERYAPLQRAFFQLLAEAPSARAFREGLPRLASACAPSCEIARAAQRALEKRNERDPELDHVVARECHDASD